MSAIVVNRLISGLESDNKLVLKSSRVARKMSIGTGWNVLRVGFRIAISGSGDLNFTPTFAFGLCSGTANVIGDATTDAFVGAFYTGATWTYTHQAYIPYYTPASSFTAMTKTGTVYQIITATSAAKMSANHTGVRQVLAFEINKTSNTAATISATVVGGGNPTKDTLSGIFLQAIASNPGIDTFHTTLAALGGDTLSQFSPTTFTTFPPNVLDTICFSWNSSQAAIEITDVAYARLG